jgi:hypothetical protein
MLENQGLHKFFKKEKGKMTENQYIKDNKNISNV